ncbi:MAG: LptA/OstA family protein [Steroidobacteraceae bacterium]
MAASRPEPTLSAARRLLLALACACPWPAAATEPAPVADTAAPAARPAPAEQRQAAGLPAGNSEQPIKLEAASSDFDYKNNSLLFRRVKITQGVLEVTAQQANATGLEFEDSEWRLQGEVRISVPGGSLQSSEARVQFRRNAIVSATINGTPAAFEQQLQQDGQTARGKASAIDYDVQKNVVRLSGDAWLSDGKNEIRGNTLVYDIAGARVQANPGGKDPDGVRITITPPKKTPAAAPTPGSGT